MNGRSVVGRACLALTLTINACGDTESARVVESDPVLGTWLLNVPKSTFVVGRPPKSQTVTFDSAATGIRVTSETVNADGSVSHSTYTAAYDGKRYPISGTPSADSVSFARLDQRTVERFDTRGSTFVGSVTRIVSPDGKTLTVMSKPIGAQGRTVGNILVYDRK
jgi:hypothetical protein